MGKARKVSHRVPNLRVTQSRFGKQASHQGTAWEGLTSFTLRYSVWEGLASGQFNRMKQPCCFLERGTGLETWEGNDLEWEVDDNDECPASECWIQAMQFYNVRNQKRSIGKQSTCYQNFHTSLLRPSPSRVQDGKS